MSALYASVQFVNDDPGYIRWLTANPEGFVVNSNRVPMSSYLKLHRSSCKYISPPAYTNWTTTGYIKTCSTDLAALVQWARTHVGGDLDPCRACKPVVRRVTNVSTVQRNSQAPKTRIAPALPPPAQSIPQSRSLKTLPPEISTGCPELDRAWSTYATMILERSHILIADTDDDLTWHAFLGHSIDMQGFRAAEFAGVDPLTRHAPKFVPLKRRGIGVPELAGLWEIPEVRSHFRKSLQDVPFSDTLNLLRARGAGIGGSIAEAFDFFPWRKFHWAVRALLENSARLKPFDFSFRRWLQNECLALGVGSFPPHDFRTPVELDHQIMSLEQALRARLERTFYMVGPAMSAYMLCDWQLWLWRADRTTVFANFKLDSFHEGFVKKFGEKTIPASETGFARWWLDLFPDLPPRLANECIWLAVENKLVDLS
jgi:hypothetical protein